MLKLPGFCAISYTMTALFWSVAQWPLLVWKLSLIALWFDASVGTPRHFNMWVPLPPPPTTTPLTLVSNLDTNSYQPKTSCLDWEFLIKKIQICPKSKTKSYTVCPRKKLSKFWRHFALKVTRIWQYQLVEQNAVVFWIVFQISEKLIDQYIKYKRLKWHMYGTIFPTFAKCRSHTWGFTGVQTYTDQDTSSLSDPFTA